MYLKYSSLSLSKVFKSMLWLMGLFYGQLITEYNDEAFHAFKSIGKIFSKRMAMNKDLLSLCVPSTFLIELS
jgi:hypothetical protein